jgi:putative oxidoreductase
MIKKLDRYFHSRRDYGAIFIRLVAGFHLLYGVMDNVVSWERMLEFRDFLAANGFPFPLQSAVVSVYAQFLCGICFILGLLTRFAASIMIINFLCALTIHVNGTYPQAFPAIAMLAASCFLLFHGSGKLSVDRIRRRYK